jgi:hypothetical protein
MATLHELVSFKEKNQAWVRVARRPRSLYSVSGNRGGLGTKIPRGVDAIVGAIGRGR